MMVYNDDNEICKYGKHFSYDTPHEAPIPQCLIWVETVLKINIPNFKFLVFIHDSLYHGSS